MEAIGEKHQRNPSQNHLKQRPLNTRMGALDLKGEKPVWAVLFKDVYGVSQICEVLFSLEIPFRKSGIRRFGYIGAFANLRSAVSPLNTVSQVWYTAF